LTPSRGIDRGQVQVALRVAGLAFVFAWLFLDELRASVPFWLPFVVLLAAEVEFVLRGRYETPRARRGRVPPGPEDADLGFGELVEDEDGYRYVPPPTRPLRSRRRVVAWAAGAAVVLILFVLAARADRAATWAALPAAERAATVSRLESEAAIVARKPVTIRCDEQYAFTGAGSDTLGVAFPDRGIAFLDQGVCRTLHDLVADRTVDGDRTAEALVVLAHEAVHLSGERREGVTECLALQAAVPLAARLGIADERAHELLGSAYERRLAERSAIRAAYALPRGCRNGDALDLRPDDPRFP
jgi:hypothetical protein